MERLITLIQKTFAIGFEINQDTPLISTGLIDSLHVAMLLTLLEREYGLTISTRDIGVDNFDTPRQMEAFLKNR
ncbi:MAG: acyl carrier protein [Desulfuromonadales bacterium]